MKTDHRKAESGDSPAGDCFIRAYRDSDCSSVLSIWNEVVEEGCSFPFEEPWDEEELAGFLREQTFNAVAEDGNGQVTGFYTLHPNIPGRCSSGGNATYLVRRECRGRHIGERLVKDSIRMARELGFRYMQFNGVVDSNIHARHLYARCGFKEAGVIPRGFRVKDGSYEDMHILYLDLKDEEEGRENSLAGRGGKE